MAGYCQSGAVLVLTLLLSVPAKAAETDAQRIERLERAVDELKQQIQELKRELVKPELEAPAQAAAAPTPAPAAPAPSPAAPAEVVSRVIDRVQIGGYGSTRFEADSASGLNDTFTLRRFVLTADAAIAPRLRSSFELEFERFRELELERTVEVEEGGLKVEQEVEGTDESEIAIEQIWLEYELAKALRARIGGVLIPLGRFNLNHDDNRWDLPRRSLVDRGVPVLPSTSAWDELGAGFTGDLEVGELGALGYYLYVVNGAILQPETEEIVQTRSDSRDKLELEGNFTIQTGTFGNDVKDAKAVTGRLAWSPALGHELAGSFYNGRYTPDFLPSETINSFGADGLTTWGPFELEGEYVYTDFGDIDELATAFAQTIGDKSAANPAETNPDFEAEIEFELSSLADWKQGYWLEPRWRFRPAWLKESIFGRYFEDPVLTALVRWEQVWFGGLLQELDFAGGQVTALDKVDRRLNRFTIGGSYRPVPLVVFQLAYEYTWVNEGSLAEVTNFLATSDEKNSAVLLGAAFGF